MFERFTGECPKCGGRCKDSNALYHDGFITVHLVCVKCNFGFIAMYGNGSIVAVKNGQIKKDAIKAPNKKQLP